MRKTIAAIALVMAGMICGPVALRATPVASAQSTSGTLIAQTALEYVGTAYTRTGTTPQTGFNDLSFVRYIYAQSGIHLHIAVTQHNYKRLLAKGPRIAMADLQPGDIIFFRNTIWYGLSHVAIYIGGGKFVHAEWFNVGVTVSSFYKDPRDGNYWAAKFATANRPWS